LRRRRWKNNIFYQQIIGLSKLHSSIKWQKLIITWLKEGVANSKFYHGVMSSRRRLNVIISINVNGVQIEDMEGARNAVFQHLQSHFKEVSADKPGLCWKK